MPQNIDYVSSFAIYKILTTELADENFWLRDLFVASYIKLQQRFTISLKFQKHTDEI